MAPSTWQLVLLTILFVQEGIGKIPKTKHRQPYQVYVSSKINATYSSGCVGVIVSRSAILTSASCVENAISVDIYTGALTANNDNNDVDTQIIAINPDKILFYEDEYTSTEDLRLALLPIPKKHILDKNAQIVKLPEKNRDYINKTAVATGISNNDNNDGNSRGFRISVQGTILSSEDCASQLKDQSFIEENYNCLVSNSGDLNSDDSTFGDEPDVIVAHNTDGSFTLLGINSVSNVVPTTRQLQLVFFKFAIDLIRGVVSALIVDGIYKIAKTLA